VRPTGPARAAFVGLVAVVGACGARTPLLLDEPSQPDGGGHVDSGGSPLDAPEPFDATAEASDDSPVETIDAPAPPSGDASADGSGVLTPAPDFVWYRLDETSGTTAHDSSPHHYDITNLQGVVWDGGANFDGATVCGSTTVGSAFRTAPVTITAWLTAQPRDDETSTNHALTPFPPNALSGDTPSLGGFGIGLNVWTDGTPGNGVAIETGLGSAVAFYTLGGVPANDQVFTALVISATQADLYVNASLWESVQADTPAVVTPAPLHLGCHNDDTGYLTKRFFKGRIVDARVYTRVLGGIELAQLFANGPV
jgi:hypothetical protein